MARPRKAQSSDAVQVYLEHDRVTTRANETPLFADENERRAAASWICKSLKEFLGEHAILKQLGDYETKLREWSLEDLVNWFIADRAQNNANGWIPLKSLTVHAIKAYPESLMEIKIAWRELLIQLYLRECMSFVVTAYQFAVDTYGENNVEILRRCDSCAVKRQQLIEYGKIGNGTPNVCRIFLDDQMNESESGRAAPLIKRMENFSVYTASLSPGPEVSSMIGLVSGEKAEEHETYLLGGVQDIMPQGMKFLTQSGYDHAFFHQVRRVTQFKPDCIWKEFLTRITGDNMPRNIPVMNPDDAFSINYQSGRTLRSRRVPPPTTVSFKS